MSQPPESRSLGEHITEHATASTLAYYGYVWLLHAGDYPEDYRAAQQRLDSDPLIIQRDLDFWQHVTRQEHGELLVQQLALTVSRARQEMQPTGGAPVQNEASRVSLTGLYLTQIVGPLAMKMVHEETWWSRKNTHLKTLRNPFYDAELVSDFIGYTQDRRKHRILGKYALSDKIAPGYFG